MKTKYWIIFIILGIIVVIGGIYLYFRISGKPFFPKKEKKEESLVVQEEKKETNRSIFISKAPTEKTTKIYGEIFDDLSDKDDNVEIAFFEESLYFSFEKQMYWIEPLERSKYKKIKCSLDNFKTLDNIPNSDIGICENDVYIRGEKNNSLDGKSLTAIINNYIGDKDNTYYRSDVIDREKGEIDYKLIPVDENPTDLHSASDYGLSINYAIANGKLYFKNKIYKNVDLETLHRLIDSNHSDGYFADKNNYYIADEEKGFLPITSIKTGRFEPYNFGGKNGVRYVRIGKNVYLGDKKLFGATPNNLKPYMAENRTGKGEDLITCTINCAYVWDGRNVYYEGSTMPVNDGSFMLLGYGILKGSAESFVTQPEYAKDNKNVYFEGKLVVGADPLTFTPIKSGRYVLEYGKDIDSVYYKEKKIDGADPDSFVPFDNQSLEGCPLGAYSKDSNNIFYKWNIVEKADVQSFEIVSSENAFIGKDKNNYYLGEDKISEDSFDICYK